MTSTVLLKHGKNYGIAVYIPKEIVLNEMAAKNDLVQVLACKLQQCHRLELWKGKQQDL
jgi:hypothetical protein